MKSFISLSLITFLGCSEEQSTPTTALAPRSAEVITISNATATTGQDYTASLQGKSDVEIRPQVDGFLESVLVDEGAYVTRGQVLF